MKIMIIIPAFQNNKNAITQQKLEGHYLEPNSWFVFCTTLDKKIIFKDILLSIFYL